MLGTFQQSYLRIEVEAPEQKIRESLVRPLQLRRWLWFQRFSEGMPESLQIGSEFVTWLGPVAVRHQVEDVGPNQLRLLLGQGIDGFHQWRWGEGWVQSSLEGVSLLPLNLGQTVSLSQLKAFLEGRSPLQNFNS